MPFALNQGAVSVRRRSHAGLFFLLPGVIWVLAFTIYPLIYSLTISFHRQKLGKAPKFIGIENYADIFTDLRVQETVLTSVFLSVGSVVLTLILGTFVAWLFSHNLPGLRGFRAIITMPLFAAPIALGYLGQVIFNETNGPINYLVQGVGGPAIPWITHPLWARVAVLITDTWQWTPFVFIVVLAAMQSISEELYEAAHLDTASGWMLFRHITFPLIAPALGTIAMLRLVDTFKILDIPLALLQGGPGAATQTYSYYTYVVGLRNFDLGYASALAYLLVIIAIIVTSIYFWRVRARYA
jgi:multiple sugar transport system permease protein